MSGFANGGQRSWLPDGEKVQERKLNGTIECRSLFVPN